MQPVPRSQPDWDDRPVWVPQHLHRLQGPTEHTLSTTRIRTDGRTFDTDNRHHVEMSAKKIKIGRADERAIGKDGKYHVLHLCHCLEYILAHLWLATGQQREIDAHLGRFHEYLFPLLRREGGLTGCRVILRNTIATGITPLAMQITLGCDTADEERRDIKALLFLHSSATFLRLGKKLLHFECKLRLTGIRQHIYMPFPLCGEYCRSCRLLSLFVFLSLPNLSKHHQRPTGSGRGGVVSFSSKLKSLRPDSP